jgi:FkbM family methyltransferase
MDPFSDMKAIGNLSRDEFESTCRANLFYAYMGDNTGMCRVLSKYKMYVDTFDRGIAPHLIADGFWESWLTQCIARIVEPGFVCLDIGANFGYYSLLLSALCGREGRTIAFEPNPRLCRLLRASCGIHEFPFDVMETAVSDRKGKAKLHIDQHYPGDTSLDSRKDKKDRDIKKLEVRTCSVDDIVSSLKLKRVDLVKIDVEGFEPQVFDGMKKTIRANPGIHILLEYSPFLYDDAEKFTNKIFSDFTVKRIKDVPEIITLDTGHIEELLQLTDHTDLYLTRKTDDPAGI